MKLGALLQEVDIRESYGLSEVDIESVEHDSRRVRSGSVFVAIRGERADGNDFIDRAIESGAAAIVSEQPSSRDLGVPWVRVFSARSALAAIARAFYRHPSSELTLVGVTGTDGKTTTAHLVDSILRISGGATALLGTIGCKGPGFEYSAALTTPEAPDLQRMFRAAVDGGARYGVMEVSSHAIAMQRVEGLDFDVAVFTNLSGDHLDFHGGMRAYFETKKRLFQGLAGAPPPCAVINRDDPFFEELRACGSRAVLSFGMAASADVWPGGVRHGWEGLEAEYHTPAGPLQVRSPLIGRHNLYNIGAAIGVGLAMGLDPAGIVRGIESLSSVPGRFESVGGDAPFRVIVDFAHTDRALEGLLQSVREMTPKRVIVVFGAGGDRDRGKRARMGEAAGRWSDLAVITSDNPRSEDPLAIMRMIAAGVDQTGGRYYCVEDRREAILRAMEWAEEGDTVVIAGKGHEALQQIGGRSIAFDDRAVARELMDALDAGRHRTTD